MRIKDCFLACLCSIFAFFFVCITVSVFYQENELLGLLVFTDIFMIFFVLMLLREKRENE